MQELVELVENEEKVSHRIVAQNVDITEMSIRKLIDKNVGFFQSIGTLSFKMTRVNNGKGLQQKTYYLNEEQATFLMTLLRNKPIVVEFKLKLTKAFFKLKEKTTPVLIDERMEDLLAMMKYRDEKLSEMGVFSSDAEINLMYAFQHSEFLEFARRAIYNRLEEEDYEKYVYVIAHTKEALDKKIEELKQVIINQNTIIAEHQKVLPPPNKIEHFSEKLKKRAKILTDDLYRDICGHLNTAVTAENMSA